MEQELNRQIQELKAEVDRLSKILNGISNDVRTQSVIRNAVIVGEHTTGKPTIISASGKKYKLQTV